MPDGEISANGAGKRHVHVPDHRTTGSSSGNRGLSSLYSNKNQSIDTRDIGVTKEEVSWDKSGRILNWKKVLKMIQKRVCIDSLWMVSWTFI